MLNYFFLIELVEYIIWEHKALYCQAQSKPASQSPAKLGWDSLIITTVGNQNSSFEVLQSFSS